MKIDYILVYKHVRLARGITKIGFPHTCKRGRSSVQGAAAEQAIVEQAPSDGRAPEPATPVRQYA